MATSKKSANTVQVYANLPHGQSFNVRGHMVTLNGFPVSRLRGPDGGALPSGRCGVTEISVDDWTEIQRLYGGMKIFSSGLVYAAASRADGDAQAAERSDLRHGVEPVDPDAALTKPATAEDK